MTQYRKQLKLGFMEIYNFTFQLNLKGSEAPEKGITITANCNAGHHHKFALVSHVVTG